MNKTLIIAGSVIAGLAIPFLGMTISPTRDLILGLAPDQAVLSLADQIDAQRVSVDQSKAESNAKLAEFQSTIDAQQVKLAEQQKLIDGQISSIKAESQSVKNSVSNELECRNLYSDNNYCNTDTFRNKSTYDKVIDKKKSMGINLSDYKDKFEKCQEIIAKCG